VAHSDQFQASGVAERSAGRYYDQRRLRERAWPATDRDSKAATHCRFRHFFIFLSPFLPIHINCQAATKGSSEATRAAFVLLGSPTLCEQIYKDGKDHVIADSSQPVGTVERVPDGWKAVRKRVPERRVNRGRRMRDDGGRSQSTRRWPCGTRALRTSPQVFPRCCSHSSRRTRRNTRGIPTVAGF